MELAKLFCDNMVFQAEKPVRVWGTGKGKACITLFGQAYEKTFDGKDWLMELPAQPYGGPYELSISLNGEERVLKNIAFGDVFLCSGQSNMQFTIQSEMGAKAVETDEKIRYFCCDRLEKHDGLTSADGWNVCLKNKVQNWSALGTHIAEGHRRRKDVFVGVIGCFQGASAIRAWLPERRLEQAVYVPLEDRHADYTHELYSLWNSDSALYRAMFSTLVPFAFKAGIWYQGESDTTVAEGKVYTELLSRLITSWREDLKDEKLPFIVVEICDFLPRDDEGWHCIQAAQRQIVDTVNNVRCVTSKDVCEHTDIHPCNKEKLAEKIVAAI